MGWPDDSNRYYQTLERAALRETEIIESLSSLCHELITRLSQYTDMETEERRLEELEGEMKE